VFSSTQSDIQSIIRYCGEFYNVRIEMGRLNDAQRHEAIGMIRGGAPKRVVARQMGCSHQTITKLIQRYNATGSVKDRQRPDRQRVTSVRQDRQIVITHLRDRFRTATQTARDTIWGLQQTDQRLNCYSPLTSGWITDPYAIQGQCFNTKSPSKQGGLVQTSYQIDAT